MGLIQSKRIVTLFNKGMTDKTINFTIIDAKLRSYKPRDANTLHKSHEYLLDATFTLLLYYLNHNENEKIDDVTVKQFKRVFLAMINKDDKEWIEFDKDNKIKNYDFMKGFKYVFATAYCK